MNAEVVPQFPHGLRGAAPAETAGHAEGEAEPRVAAAFEHFAHEAVGDAADADEHLLGGDVVVVAFAEPHAVHIRQRIHEDEGVAGKAGHVVQFVPRVEVDEAAARGVLVEDFAGAFHHGAVERNVVEVNAVAARVFDEPAEAFEVEVVKARLGGGEDAGVVRAGLVPSAPVVAAEMLLQPRMAPAASRREQLAAKGTQGKNLRRPVREFADGVVILHAHPEGVDFVGILAEFVGGEKGVVDVGIQLVALVDVDDIRAHRFHLRRVLDAADVEVAVLPLRGGVERLERGDGDVEIEVQRLAGLQRARAGVGGKEDGLFVFALHFDSAGSPRRREVQRLSRVVDIDHRADVILRREPHAQPGIHIAHPVGVLMLFHVPFPIHRQLRRPAVVSKAGGVFAGVGGAGDFEADVADACCRRRKFAARIQVAFAIDASRDAHFSDAICGECRFPRIRSVVAIQAALHGKDCFASVVTGRNEPNGSRQDAHGIMANPCYRLIETTGDLLR